MGFYQTLTTENDTINDGKVVAMVPKGGDTLRAVFSAVQADHLG